MAGFDRSKFKGVAPEVIQETKAMMEEMNPFSNRSGFIKLTPGSNIVRIYPAHREGANFTYPKVVSWLPFLEEKEDKKTKQKAMEIVRKPIFNARYHAGSSKDLVEEYISFGFKLFGEEIKDDKARELKLKPMIDWKEGIKPQINWVLYGKKIKSDGTKEFGRIEVTNGLMEKFNKMGSRVSDTGKPITIDVFSHPDSGKAVQIVWDKEEKDNKKKYEPTLLYEKDWTLTDEELQEFEGLESLEAIYTHCFTRADFEKQVQGLQNFDDANGFGFFQHDDFLEICEKISDYLEQNVFPDQDAKAEENKTEEEEINTPPAEEKIETTKKVVTEPSAEVNKPADKTVKKTTKFTKVTNPLTEAGQKVIDQQQKAGTAGTGSFRDKYKKKE